MQSLESRLPAPGIRCHHLLDVIAAVLQVGHITLLAHALVKELQIPGKLRLFAPGIFDNSAVAIFVNLTDFFSLRRNFCIFICGISC